MNLTMTQKLILSSLAAFLGGATAYYGIHQTGALDVRFWVGLVSGGLAPLATYWMGLVQTSPTDKKPQP